ncbi:uncharacterized protein LOC116774462 isoform X1 [Danaus plexippus]|uniref:uncharacterized protein LOC116774462 isoform X1 n=1 Tax=Danaus plexippus TaxID=13037 RepID=UPI002AAFB444|nr:uncharacterized protein LOC116774462 isoform X1 [Danaus plexippus]
MLILDIIFIKIFFIRLTIAYENENKDQDRFDMVPHHHTRTPRLEDFFWTGSGDGPPPPDLSAPVQTPTTPIIQTTTVLATVYLDSYPPQAVTEGTSGECTNCEVTPDSLDPDIPEDRRYWLLTVIQGTTPDSLQLKLARLYQKAFLRQQERHLGIIKSLDAPPARKKHDVHSFVVNKAKEFNEIHTNTAKTPVKFYEIESSTLDDLNVNNFIYNNENASYSFNISQDSKHLENIEVFSVSNSNVKGTKVSEVESWFLVTPTVVVSRRSVEEIEFNDKEDIIDLPLEDDVNDTVLFKREIIKPEQQPPVQVQIQNITESTGSVQIVYVVLVGGRAVPAAVAARDMRLVRDAEVATELGAIVTTKAEPAYLKAAEGLEAAGSVQGTELWALLVGSVVAVLLLLVLFILLCFAHRRRKQIKSAASIRAYHHEMMMEAERKQMKQITDERDGKLVSVVSPNRTRPSSVLLPVYRTGSVSGSSSSSSGVSELAAALRRRHKKPRALRLAHRKRAVGTTDSLLQAAGVDSSDPGSPPTPTSYLSMPSVNAFPRGNTVEPLSKILEPISVRHLDLDSTSSTPKKSKNVVPRRQMPSQLVRLGSIDKDPGVIGPLVWDLHCQRIKDTSKPSSPAQSKVPSNRMRQRFNDLMDDAYTLFGSASSATDKRDTDHVPELVTQARNEDVRVPTTRGSSAGLSRPSALEPSSRARTAAPRSVRPPPSAAWTDAPTSSVRVPQVNPSLIVAEGRLDPADPALPIISAIQSEIKRVRDNARPQ